MCTTANTIFLTGATSGIGRGLAESFHQRGNQVIFSGRRCDGFADLCDRNPGMRFFPLDVTDPAAIRAVARQVTADFPELNCVINNAGIRLRPDFGAGAAIKDCDLAREIDTNLLAPIRVAEAFLPHLASRPAATLINVSSGLAFVPIARFPVYRATRAALHSGDRVDSLRLTDCLRCCFRHAEMLYFAR
jgi:uncharacterized oxidoreductase